METENVFARVVASLLGRVSAVLASASLIAAPTWASPPSIALPGDQAYPESITATRNGTMYVGSAAAGGVFRIRPHAPQAEIWIPPGAFGTRSILGVLADERSNTLWACSDDLSAFGIPGPNAIAGSALKGFDLKSGEGMVSAVLPGDHTLCNDIAIGPDGSAYVTNTVAPQILRLPPKGKQLEIWLSDPALQPPPGGAGLDGIAFGSDGNLYVDTYSPGDLFRIELKKGRPGQVMKLHATRPLVLADAIRPLGRNSFLIVEGGGRLDRMVISGDTASIATLEDGYVGPTGVALVGRTAWVTEGQMGYLVDPSKKGQKPTLPFHVYSVDLTTSSPAASP